MRIIKRDGSEATFDVSKIISAVSRANNEVSDNDKIRTAKEIEVIAESVQYLVEEKGSIPSIEDVQEYVISELQRRGYYVLARKYIRYMEVHKLMRGTNTTDAKLLSLVDGNNEEAKQENANKNPVINSTQRDYMAGEVSKDLTRRYLLPPDIVTAHEEGIIHFHDMDYYAQHMHNCDLVNMDDMLQNGTVITGTTIDKPKLFSTACNITTQVIAQVASVQYGGQTVNIGDLVPFVDVSRQRFKAHVLDELAMTNTEMSEEDIDRVVEVRVLRDVKRGVKLMQYQVLTLMTTNGQTPFITMVLDITSVPECQQEDAAIVFEEILRQRIRGVKNKQGVWVTPAFPKLVYILDEFVAKHIRRATCNFILNGSDEFRHCLDAFCLCKVNLLRCVNELRVKLILAVCYHINAKTLINDVITVVATILLVEETKRVVVLQAPCAVSRSSVAHLVIAVPVFGEIGRCGIRLRVGYILIEDGNLRTVVCWQRLEGYECLLTVVLTHYGNNLNLAVAAVVGLQSVVGCARKSHFAPASANAVVA